MADILKALSQKKYFHSLAGASEEQIDGAEKDLGVKFDLDYRKILCNYGTVSFDGHEIVGICSFRRLNVVDVTNEERKDNDNIKAGYYVIERSNIDGNIIWQNSSGAIYRAQRGMLPVKIYDSLAQYFDV